MFHAAAIAIAVSAWFAWHDTGTAAQGTTSTAGITRGAWTWLGPGNFAGRIKTIAADPNVSLSLLAGAADGGIWRTTDGGVSWTPVNDFLSSLAVSTIVYKPGNSSIVVAGTGNGFYDDDAVAGAGIFKSTDGGRTWSQLSSTSTADFTYVNRLAYSADGQILLAATRTGLFRSADDGASWTLVLNPATAAGGNAGHADMADVKFLVGSRTNAVAGGLSSNAYYSLDGGQTWQSSVQPGVDTTAAFHRVELAVAQSNVVYLSLDNVSPSGRDFVPSGQIWKSTSSGQTYAVINNLAQLYQFGLHQNALWVDPFNAANVIAGGMDIWTSTNGGTTFDEVTDSYAPSGVANQPLGENAIVADGGYNGTTNRRVYVATNRGVYRADDWAAVTFSAGGFIPLDNGLGTAQFFSGAVTPAGTIIGGTANNGTIVYTPSAGPQAWRTLHFNAETLAGGFVAADPTNANYLFAEDQFLALGRSSDGGSTFEYIYGGTGSGACTKAAPYQIADLCASGHAVNAVAPFVLDPNTPTTLLAGAESLWRTTDVRTANTSTTGPSWTAIKPGDCPGGTCSAVSAIAIAPGNSATVFVGHNNGDVWRTTTGTAATPSWTLVGAGVLPARTVRRIVVDPSNVNRVYATFDGYATPNLWRSSDGGSTWSALVGSGATALPPSPVRAFAINPSNSSWLYAGTDGGVFASADGGATWSVPQQGPANVRVDDLFWTGSSTLVAATHGRGMFSFNTNVACTSATSITQTSASFPGSGGGGTITVTSGTGCAWTATSNVSFVTITSGSSGTGSGSIQFSVAANGATASRSGSITVNGSTFTIAQNAGVTIAPTSLVFAATKLGTAGALQMTTATQNVTVTFDGAGSTWTVSADQPWVQVSTTSGSGSGQFTVSITNPNNMLGASSSATATATLVIPGLSLTERIPVQLTVQILVPTVNLFWRNTQTGDLDLWRLPSGTSISAMGMLSQAVPLDWNVVALGDLDHNGQPDLIWRNGRNGDVAAWLVNGSAIAQTGLVAQGVPSNWQIVGTGDVDQDGKADLFWRNVATGDVAVWLMDGVSVKRSATGAAIIPVISTGVPLTWQIAGIGDLDGDGVADLVWRNTATGDVAVWRLANPTDPFAGPWATATPVIARGVPLSWTIVGVGDMDGDGKADVIWRDTQTGDVAVWFMDGTTVKSIPIVSAGVPLSWQIARAGDLDGDGKADFIWHNAQTGAVSVWLMDGTTLKQSAVISTFVPLQWQIR